MEETSPRCGVCMCVSVTECMHVFGVFASVFVVLKMCACVNETPKHTNTDFTDSTHFVFVWTSVFVVFARVFVWKMCACVFVGLVHTMCA